MITLCAEVLCDSCGKVCGVGEPTPAKGDNSHWIWSACHEAESKARSHGAQINVATTTCAECLAKQNEIDSTIIQPNHT